MCELLVCRSVVCIHHRNCDVYVPISVPIRGAMSDCLLMFTAEDSWLSRPATILEQVIGDESFKPPLRSEHGVSTSRFEARMSELDAYCRRDSSGRRHRDPCHGKHNTPRLLGSCCFLTGIAIPASRVFIASRKPEHAPVAPRGGDTMLHGDVEISVAE